ncbi:MAG TPA: lysine N(6)-hydroxylase/L-ornithine N(5)-oxygenase family protein [Trichocoleus sp.]
MSEPIYDLLGVGLGPFNLGLAALLEPISEVKALFLEQKPQFQWHSGLLLEGSTIQVPFLADLVTMADPCSRFSFLNYLREQARLYHFYFWEEFHIPRREYNHYCQWVAGQLESCRFGESVESIIWQDGPESHFEVRSRHAKSGEVRAYRARHLSLGVGSVPQVPACFKDWLPAENIFHSAQFAQRRDRCRQAKSITVIGSGQSAAEVFYELLQEQETCGYRLEWHTRSAGFFPMEYSKLGLEHFSPDYLHYFYHLAPEQRDRVLAQQGLLYKGISFSTIAQVYDLLYERSVGGHQPNVRLLPLVEVKEVEALKHGATPNYRLRYRHRYQDAPFTHETDCIILATGYDHAIPQCVEGVRSLIQWDEQNRYVVQFDYRLALTKDIPNQIFVQNAEMHTHGVGAPDLGLGAHRNSVIINTLLKRSQYPVHQHNVFQQFGVA